MTDKLQQDFEVWAARIYGTARMGFSVGFYSRDEVHAAWQTWQAAHNKYSQDSQKYIDLLRDLYYTHGYELPSGSFQKIEKLLGDLL